MQKNENSRAVLLTGGAGYIGSHIAVELAAAGKQTVIVDNLRNASEDALRGIAEITGSEPVFYRVDARDKDAMREIVKCHGIADVIHLAGLKSVAESTKEPLEYYNVNLGTTLTLLEVLLESGEGRIIFSSSATVYGIPDHVPVTEEAIAGRCFNPYGRTKYFNEQIINDVVAASEGKLSAVLLRYFNPIGAHPSGLIGEVPTGVPNNLMPYITQVAAGKREKLYIYGNDYETRDGTGVRDYIHVVDLARGHVKALEWLESHGKGKVEIFNLGTGQGRSVLEIVETFQRVNNIKIPYEFAPRRPGDIAEYYADPSKAERELGWRAELSLEDMCRDAWNAEKTLQSRAKKG
ncbi:MAG TPA: UDP-glucose 4-epimerase GalE [Bacillota bacterium]|nr:UDP-glucose 4-epimerase GalE [Clostridiales bacterium]HPT84766.1 UDP-glucose 4-epimerase GalE [Bacillota bacterium]